MAKCTNRPCNTRNTSTCNAQSPAWQCTGLHHQHTAPPRSLQRHTPPPPSSCADAVGSPWHKNTSQSEFCLQSGVQLVCLPASICLFADFGFVDQRTMTSKWSIKPTWATTPSFSSFKFSSVFSANQQMSCHQLTAAGGLLRCLRRQLFWEQTVVPFSNTTRSACAACKRVSRIQQDQKCRFSFGLDNFGAVIMFIHRLLWTIQSLMARLFQKTRSIGSQTILVKLETSPPTL